MKAILSVSIVLTILISCGGGKNVQLDNAPMVKIENPYWQEVFAGQEGGENSIVLILPCAVPLENYGIDSVYFHGFHSKLTQSIMKKQNVYRTRILLNTEKNGLETPFSITEDQALVSYVNKEKKKYYFRIKEIEKREPIYMP